jgi:protein-tyrosine-phosphatase
MRVLRPPLGLAAPDRSITVHRPMRGYQSRASSDDPSRSGDAARSHLPTSPPAEGRSHVLVLCTGNAARSVIAGALLDACGVDVKVTTAGTHVIEHQPMSRRTRDALSSIGIDAPAHRSRQVSESDVESADLVIAMEADHVRYVRRRHPDAASRTATLRWLVENLPAGDQELSQRVAGLHLAELDPDLQGEVEDPAGGDEAKYRRCARELQALIDDLADRIR